MGARSATGAMVVFFDSNAKAEDFYRLALHGLIETEGTFKQFERVLCALTTGGRTSETRGRQL